MPTDGLITVSSLYSAKERMDRLEAETKAKSMKIFTRIDHAQVRNRPV
jgi:uncharacterized protein (DUF302 family)